MPSAQLVMDVSACGIPAEKDGMVWGVGFQDKSASFTRGMSVLDGDLDRVEYVDTTRDWDSIGGGFEPGELNLGRAIKPEHLPTKIQYEGKRYGIPEVVHGCQLFCVNDRFRDVVEAVEPGVHQYFPVDMLWEDDGTLAQKMFIFNVCNRLDTVSREASTTELRHGMMWEPSTGEMVYSLPRIGDHHIWIDRHTSATGMFFCSDRTHQALMDAGITGIESGPCPTTEAL